MAEHENSNHDSENEDNEMQFKAPAQKTITEIMEADKEDEALNRYKQALLGDAANQAGLNEDPVMIFEKLVVAPTDGGTPLNYTLQVKPVKCVSQNKKLAEGSKYIVEIHFTVKTGLISGLKYHHNVSRIGVRLDKNAVMVGSFAASSKPYVFKTEEDVAPSGIAGRGTYHVTSKFLDDDRNLYLAFEWDLEIVKAGKA